MFPSANLPSSAPHYQPIPIGGTLPALMAHSTIVGGEDKTDVARFSRGFFFKVRGTDGATLCQGWRSVLKKLTKWGGGRALFGDGNPGCPKPTAFLGWWENNYFVVGGTPPVPSRNVKYWGFEEIWVLPPEIFL